MAKYKVYIKPSAVKEIEAIPQKNTRQQIVRCIQSLAREPRPSGCKKLSARNRYRIRKGIYRVVYSVEDDQLTVYVVKVGHRKEVYRGVF